jgi:Uma2 family endonuclease
VARVADILRCSFGPDNWVRQQAPLAVGKFTTPTLELSVVAGNRQSYTAHPTTALLAVEIGDFLLNDDREIRACLYAELGIPEYWIVNLVDGQLEVYRQPIEEGGGRYRFRYASRQIIPAGGSVTPMSSPGHVINTDDLLGR